MSWINRFGNLFRSNKLEREVSEELQFHLAARVRDNLAAGMTPEEARSDAARRLGGEALSKEKTRDADILLWLDTLGRDVRFALRNLLKNRGVTAIAMISLALGIGANTAIFSAVHAVLLRPLPYKDPGRLGMLWLDNRPLGLHEDLTSFPNYEDWKKNGAFSELAGFVPGQTILTGLAEPSREISALTTSNLLSVLGVAPAMGRAFTSEEEQPERGRVVILSNNLWKRQFGSDPNVLGKTVELDNRPYQIVGVMPSDFNFPSKDTQLWKPLALPADARGNRGGFFLSVVGRLNPGISWERAKSEMSGVAARLEQQYPDYDKGYGIWVVPLLSQVVGAMRPALLVLLAAVAFVLLIACVNVANLFLGRGAARTREIAVRAALGAGRGRLIRQLLTESTVLSLSAGVLGLAIAYWGIRTLVLFAPQNLPRLDEISINGPVLGFTLVVSIVSGILFGIAPALRVSRVDLNDALREGGRSQSTGRRLRTVRTGLTVAEVALSMVLLTGSGLMIRSLLNLRATQPGFQTDNLLTWRISGSQSKITNGPQATAFFADVLQRIERIPGVVRAGAITDIFLSPTPNSGGFAVEGQPPLPPGQQIEATIDRISTSYFQTIGVPLLRGRFVDDHDGRDTTPVILINDTMARRFWPNGDAVGKRFKFGDLESRNPWLTVVGVVGDMRRQGVNKPARCETFFPLAQRPSRAMTLVVRTSTDPDKLASIIRDTVRGLDPSAVLWARSTIAAAIGDSLAQRRFETLLLGLFSALALLLAAVGIYGVVYQSVSQRINEIGIRVALGAQKGALLKMIVGEALTMVALGAAAGALAAFAVARALSSFLFEVTAADPLTYLAVAGLLALAAVLASAMPARRAVSVDPINALRYE